MGNLIDSAINVEAIKNEIKQVELLLKSFIDQSKNAADSLRDIYENSGQIKSIKSLTDAQNAYNKALDNINLAHKGQKESLSEIERLEKKLIIAQNDDSKLKAKLNEQIRRINQENKEYAKVNMASANSLEYLRLKSSSLSKQLATADIGSSKYRELEKELRNVNKTITKAEAGYKRFGTNVGNYAGGIVKSFAKMSAAYLSFSAIFGVVKSASKTIREFEQANSDLATVLGKNKDDIDKLTESAKVLGNTTEWMASNVTELQTELAKLGFNETEIINMQESILQFSTAVGANLADAATLAGASLRAFGLESVDTERAVSVMTLGANKSAISFDYLKTAMSTIAPVAKTFGFSIEDTVALLGTLANSGFDASSAATATRNILLNLADSNGKLAKELGSPVRSLNDLTKSFSELRDSGIDLAGTLELTDKRSVSAFNTFLEGAESMHTLRSELEETEGVMRNIQRERLDTLEGSMKLLNSAWEGFILNLSKSNGIVRKFVDILTNSINFITKLTSSSEALNVELFKEIDSFTYLSDKTGEMIDEYDELSKKTNLNADEQANLKKITNDLAKSYPGAVLEIDKYGNALGINTEKIREYIKAEKNRLQFVNRAEIERTENMIKNYERDVKELQKAANEKNKIVRSGYSSFGASTYTNIAKSNEELLADVEALKNANNLLIGAQEQLKRLNGNLFEESAIREDFNKMNIKQLENWINDEKNALNEYVEIAKEVLKLKKENENGAINVASENTEENREIIESDIVERLALKRKLEDLEVANMEDGFEKQRAILLNNYNREIEDLKANGKLKEEIKEQYRIKYEAKLQEINENELKQNKSFYVKNLELKISNDEKILELESLNQEKYTELYEKIIENKREILQKQYEMELEEAEKLGVDKLLISEKYRLAELQLMEDDKEKKGEILQQQADNQIKIFEQGLDKQVIDLKKKYTDGLLTKEKFNEEFVKLGRDLMISSIENQIDQAERLLQSDEITASKRAEIEGNIATLRLNLENAVVDDVIKTNEEKLEKFKEIFDQYAGYALDALSIINDAMSVSFENQLQRVDEKLKQSQSLLEQEQERLDATEMAEEERQARQEIIDKKKAENEKKADAEKQKIKERQAKWDKANSIAQAVIQTALGIAKAIPNPILMAAAGIAGAAQIAIIAAQPIPQYYKGGKTKGEQLSMVAELRPEVAVSPSGKVQLFEKPTITKFDKGTEIFSSVPKFLNSMKSGEGNGIEINYEKLSQAIKEGKSDVFVNLSAKNTWSVQEFGVIRRLYVNQSLISKIK